ncbi:hypothetical protein D0A37_25570 [Microcoleus vaginatus HSN003]|nr:hypothetical protein D0A37_25570 [Microcoleus vaginatus HSN003]
MHSRRSQIPFIYHKCCKKESADLTDVNLKGAIMPDIAILASFVNFLWTQIGFGEGWGGIKNLLLLQGFLENCLDDRLR